MWSVEYSGRWNIPTSHRSYAAAVILSVLSPHQQQQSPHSARCTFHFYLRYPRLTRSLAESKRAGRLQQHSTLVAVVSCGCAVEEVGKSV